MVYNIVLVLPHINMNHLLYITTGINVIQVPSMFVILPISLFLSVVASFLSKLFLNIYTLKFFLMYSTLLYSNSALL